MSSNQPQNNQEKPEKFIDRPSPSILLVILICLVMILGLLAIPFGFYLIFAKIVLYSAIFMIGGGLLALLYTSLTLVALSQTRYSLNQIGVDIRFGIWHRFFAWEEFNGYHLHKGFFGNKISSPGVSPCVRLNDAVILKMKNGKVVYLTPKDSNLMLNKLAEFIPVVKS